MDPEVPISPPIEPQTVTQQHTVSSEPSGSNKLLYVLGAVVAVMLIGGAAYYLGYDHGFEKSAKNLETSSTVPPQSPSPSPSPTPDPTANWKTYNGTEGFSIKYPAIGFIRLLCPDEDLVLDDSMQYAPGALQKGEVSLETCGRGGRFDIEVQTYIASEAKQMIPQQDNNYSVVTEDITIGGTTTKKYTITPTATCYGMCAPEWRTEIYLTKGNTAYTFHLWNQHYQDTFDKMLSTFKFVQ